MSDLMKDEIEFNVKLTSNKKKRMSILDELDSIDEQNDTPLMSSLFDKQKENKKKEKEEKRAKQESEEDDEEDFMSFIKAVAPKTKKGKKFKFNVDYGDGKKKKKKNKDKDIVNHKKDFEPEMMMLRNLQLEQDKFVDSLQKKYDQMENTKSTARGVGKYTTDLINTITSARATSLQIVDKIISTKKTIADLDFKERKEFGSNNNSEQANLTNYASTYLKQMMTVGRTNIVDQSQNYSVDEIDSDDTEDLFSSIDESLGETDRSDEVDKYLKYENDNIEVKVIWYDSVSDDDITKKYDFIAEDPNGNVIDDYPIPEKTKMSINRSTGMATDLYGTKYKLIVK